MGLLELLILAAALSTDAFSAALASGLAARDATASDALKMSFFFGLFQFLMPVAGNGVSLFFIDRIGKYGDLAVFLILTLLGIHMLSERGESVQKNAFALSSVIPLAFATSIDALAAGVTVGASQTAVLPAAAIIGVTAFLFTLAGVQIGTHTSGFAAKKASIAGGVMLIALGIRSAVSFILAIL